MTTEDIQKLFLDGFEHVVLPHIKSLEEDVAGIRTQLNRMEPKLDSTIARMDDHSVRLERLEKTREQ